jgi:hypothetical protein
MSSLVFRPAQPFGMSIAAHGAINGGNFRDLGHNRVAEDQNGRP